MRRLIILILCAVTWAGSAHAGSFTISSPATADVRATTLNGRSGKTLANHGQATYFYTGYYIGYVNGLLDFEKLPDSMQQVVTDSGAVTWDSGKVTLAFINFVQEDDSVWASFFKVIRPWIEGLGTGGVGSEIDTCGACWDSANAINYTGCSGDQDEWGTAGCENISTDRSATREAVGSHPDSVLLHDGIASNDEVVFWVSGATVTDTLGKGLFMKGVAYAGATVPPTNTNMLMGFYSDDYTVNAAYRPKIQVWYTKVTGDGAGARRRLMLKEN